MDTDRTFTRHPVAICVWFKTVKGWEELWTVDVSRVGRFVRCDHPVPELRALQMRVELPGGKVIELVARVRRPALTVEEHPLAPGMGLEFFAMAREVSQDWHAFVTSLRSFRKPEPVLLENSQDLRGQLPPAHVMDMLRKFPCRPRSIASSRARTGCMPACRPASWRSTTWRAIVSACSSTAAIRIRDRQRTRPTKARSNRAPRCAAKR